MWFQIYLSVLGFNPARCHIKIYVTSVHKDKLELVLTLQAKGCMGQSQ